MRKYRNTAATNFQKSFRELKWRQQAQQQIPKLNAIREGVKQDTFYDYREFEREEARQKQAELQSQVQERFDRQTRRLAQYEARQQARPQSQAEAAAEAKSATKLNSCKRV